MSDHQLKFVELGCWYTSDRVDWLIQFRLIWVVTLHDQTSRLEDARSGDAIVLQIELLLIQSLRNIAQIAKWIRNEKTRQFQR